MHETRIERKGLGNDELTEEWFSDLLRDSCCELRTGNVAEAESLVTWACLFALERMNTYALAESISVLALVLEAKGKDIHSIL